MDWSMGYHAELERVVRERACHVRKRVVRKSVPRFRPVNVSRRNVPGTCR